MRLLKKHIKLCGTAVWNMTNEQVIKLIQEIEEDGRNVTAEHIEALNLAIKALETGKVYMSGEDYNMYLAGYKDAKKEFKRQKGNCEKCDFRKFAETFVDLMNKNGIASVEQLSEILKGGNEDGR